MKLFLGLLLATLLRGKSARSE